MAEIKLEVDVGKVTALHDNMQSGYGNSRKCAFVI